MSPTSAKEEIREILNDSDFRLPQETISEGDFEVLQSALREIEGHNIAINTLQTFIGNYLGGRYSLRPNIDRVMPNGHILRGPDNGSI